MREGVREGPGPILGAIAGGWADVAERLKMRPCRQAYGRPAPRSLQPALSALRAQKPLVKGPRGATSATAAPQRARRNGRNAILPESLFASTQPAVPPPTMM